MAVEGLVARLLLDEDVHVSLALALRDRGYDAIHTSELGRQGRSDEQQLAFAAAEGRVLVTHNRDHFLVVAKQWWERGDHHAGIIYARQASVGELLRRLLTLLNQVAAEELHDVILPLEAFG